MKKTIGKGSEGHYDMANRGLMRYKGGSVNGRWVFQKILWAEQTDSFPMAHGGGGGEGVRKKRSGKKNRKTR